MIGWGDMRPRCASMQTKEPVTVYKEPREAGLCSEEDPKQGAEIRSSRLHKNSYQVENIGIFHIPLISKTIKTKF